MKRIEAEIHESHLFEAVNRVVKKHIASDEGAYQSALVTTVGMILMEILEEFATIVSEEGMDCPTSKENTRGH